MNSQKNVILQAFLQRENDFNHRAYNIEFEYYTLIADGKLDEVKAKFASFDTGGAGILSSNPVNNIRYHFIITAALVARYCIESGMELEIAYGLSDYYINLADTARTVDHIEKLHYELICDYTTRMHSIRHTNIHSKPVVLVMDYIYDHLHQRITIDELAEYVALSPAYLSKLFRKEVGQTISEYIICRRLTAAENMLKYSDYSLSDIANYLAFSSQSHFSSVFKKRRGISPSEYRSLSFRNDVTGLGASDHAQDNHRAEGAAEKV